ncbi:MAG: apolipoprotein N-acyltransferase [Planctomycetes bacterium]|nr:apolipoprotein N-acyltransferase [Planctomycetota bacterium]MBL7144435.1 apolipoprotein N-acyltransferase [Phycisphaerae bacterium]
MKNILLFALPLIATAVMLTVIQPPISWASLAWVAFVPFIIACSPDTKPRRLILVSYVISLFYWLGNLYWLVPVTIAGWIVFCLYTALLWPILAMFLRYCRAKKVPLFLASAVLIVAIERMQGFFLGRFFWRFLAHSQYQNITIIQIADIFGTAGLSFLIAMVNGMLAELIIAARQKSLFKIVPLLKTALVCLAVAGAIIYGRWRISQEQQYVEPGPYIASLQSNVPQSVKRSFESGQELFDGLMENSKAAVKNQPDLIIWPETMVQATLNPDVLRILQLSNPSDQSIMIDRALSEHAKDKAFVLVGAYGGQIAFQDNSNAYLAKRYNSAFLYKKDGQKAPQVYSKIHLVPFGEVLPLRRSMSWFYELLMKIKFIPYKFDYSLDAGTEYTIFEMTDPNKIQNYKFSVMICYEGTVPAIARRFALDKQGTKQIDWLVNISNDGWFVRFKDGKVIPSAELPQHAATCAFRAVENRLPIVRSVNTGISCFIDSAGRIRDGFLAGTLPPEAMSRTGMSGWILDRISIDRRITIFSKYGQWLGFCCEFCLLLPIIIPLSVRFLRTIKYRTRSLGLPNGT